MVHYLIEFRFHEKAKHEIKELIREVNHKFKLQTKRAIPHILLQDLSQQMMKKD